MSFLLANIRGLARGSRSLITNNLKNISQSSVRYDEEDEGTEAEPKAKARLIDPSKDRTQIIPVETSIRYLESEAYKTTYGDKPVWTQYRRNFKGQYAPARTRRTCIRDGVIASGSPCPICRDEYLVVDYRNVKLLRQFLSEYNGEILGTLKTGVCRKQHWQLLVHIHKAKDSGLLPFDVPFREYDYSDWYDFQKLKAQRLI